MRHSHFRHDWHLSNTMCLCGLVINAALKKGRWEHFETTRGRCDTTQSTVNFGSACCKKPDKGSRSLATWKARAGSWFVAWSFRVLLSRRTSAYYSSQSHFTGWLCIWPFLKPSYMHFSLSLAHLLNTASFSHVLILLLRVHLYFESRGLSLSLSSHPLVYSELEILSGS